MSNWKKTPKIGPSFGPKTCLKIWPTLFCPIELTPGCLGPRGMEGRVIAEETVSNRFEACEQKTLECCKAILIHYNGFHRVLNLSDRGCKQSNFKSSLNITVRVDKVWCNSPWTVVWFSHIIYFLGDYQRLCKQLPKLIKLQKFYSMQSCLVKVY